uniref:Uncharacterized protein n=1 Tax=Photinus pyralis TaxID=7054 RepID=A0A1Y1KTI7_PHOPY
MKANIAHFLFLWCVIQVTSTDEKGNGTTTHECLKELNLDESILYKMVDETFRMGTLDEDGIRLMKCGIEKDGLLTANGHFNREALTKDIVHMMHALDKGDRETTAAGVYDKCETTKGEDDVDKIRNWINCVSDEIENL